MNAAITPTQQRLLDILHTHQREYGEAPLLEEIAQALGIRSRGVVHRHLQALQAAGLIEIEPRRRRGIRLCGDGAAAEGDDAALPLLGRIAAGRPIEAVADQQTLDLRCLAGPNRYALRVQGESMIEAGILDGDTVIIEAAESARAGEIVVALLNGGEVTLKYYYPRPDGSVVLAPANSRMEPMRFAADQVSIQGRLVGQVRIY